MGTLMRVLVGYDGSASSDAAVRDLKWACLPREGEFVVMSVADVILPIESSEPTLLPSNPAIETALQRAKDSVTKATTLALKAEHILRADFPGWSIRTVSCADSPAWALIKKAEDWRADLIVVGAGGHSGMGRFLGSVSQMVLVQSNCSVRVGRTRNPNGPILRVVIGIDGSPDCDLVVAEAARRFGSAGTKFLLISAVDLKMFTIMSHMTPSSLRWFLEQADDSHRVAGKMLEFYADKLRKTGAVVTCLVREQDPKDAIISESEGCNADCILVGARGLGHMRRLLIGGVSLAVAARAHCSVEVIRQK